MKNTLAYVCALAGMSLVALQVQAESLTDGSAENGKTKAVTCAACHGADGISVNPLWPNLAGQGAPYLVAQLKAFKEGLRENPLMTSQAMMLSEQDMADLAVYFEGLPAPVQAVADPKLVGKGEALYRGGDVTNQVAACIACHGPTGTGNPAAAYPALKGQHAAYTAKQLRDYASGDRVSDGKTRIMREIAGKLSADEIDALASYVQGLK
jgi:cytochrome c553